MLLEIKSHVMKGGERPLEVGFTRERERERERLIDWLMITRGVVVGFYYNV